MEINKHKKTKSLYSRLDLFGIGYNFMINGEEKYKTTTGASLTILLSIIMLALFFSFGINLYERKHPTASSNKVVGKYERTTFANNNFTYAFRIEDQYSKLNIDPGIHNFEIWWSAGIFNEISGVWEETGSININPTRCHDLPDIKQKEKIFNISLENWFCLDFRDNFTMGGSFSTNFVYFWQINALQCTNSTANNNTCKSQEEISQAFDNNRTSTNFFYSYLYLEAVASMDNFEVPLTNTLVNRFQMLSLQATKRDVQTFKKVQMKNDIGWFFSDLHDIEIYANDDIQPDFVLKNKWEQNILFSYFGYYGRNYDSYTRSYTKVQQVLAAVGGFSKFFYTSTFLIYYYFSKTHRNLHLLNILDQEQEFNFTSNSSPEGNNSLKHPAILNNFFHNNFKETDTNFKIFRNKNDISKREIGGKTDFQLLNLNPNFQNSKIIASKTEDKIDVSFSGLLCFKFFKCCLGKNRKLKLKFQYELYKEEQKLIHKLFDSSNFIKFQKEFHNLKDILLNEQQQILLSVISANLKNMYNTPTYKERMTKLLEMLSEPEMRRKIENDQLSQKLLQILDNTQKDPIYQKINNSSDSQLAK